MAEITLTKENFKEEVLQSSVPVLVDFWASWCGPCRMIAPTVEEIAKEYDGKIKVGKVNVDDEGDLAAEYDIMYIPTLIVFKDGKVTNVSNGLKRKDEILKMLEI
ncbi:MAG: thioredoxin [Clostridia bacterium]|nr:thioredoxin [Clostridia bacterium]